MAALAEDLEESIRVSLWKPEVGNWAAASYTRALASSMNIFNAACRQAGIVVARQPMEILNLSAAFSALPLPRGNRVAVLTLGDGWGVVTTDVCVESGIEVPPLEKNLVSRIGEVLSPYWSHTNPVDIVGETNPLHTHEGSRELAGRDGCDAIIHLGIVGRSYVVSNIAKAISKVDPARYEQAFRLASRMVEESERAFVEHTIRLMEKHGKPILGVMLIEDEKNKVMTEIPGSGYKGVAFPAPERGVKALDRMVEYQSWKKRNSASPGEQGGAIGL